MATEIRVPTLGESVTEATISQWFKKPGEAVAADEPVVELGTHKGTGEGPAPTTGVDPASLQGSGKGGRVTKGDMLAAAEARSAAPAPASAPAAYAPPQTPAQ